MVQARTYLETDTGDDEIVSVSREPDGSYRFSHAPHHRGSDRYTSLDEAVKAYKEWLDEYIEATRDEHDNSRAS